MRIIKILLLSALILLPLLLSACKKTAPAEESKPSPVFRKDGSLDILAPDGTVKTSFDLEIVESESEVRQGLKYRDKMADNQAMLFILDGQGPSGFWMQDTYLSLDMLFIDREQNIFQIETHTTPFSEERIEPEKINKYTLEIKAGIAEKLNIQKGDKIRWQRIK
ncbi:MAG TPA: DUF192 domain-containing protein [Candidatus Cloacimonadota bacterium]|nr:DUF192 domain-containing protein [Candidatus Cloacimonadota bacterium]